MLGKTFGGLFGEVMKKSGLPAPGDLFGSLKDAQSSIQSIVSVVKEHGTDISVSELLEKVPHDVLGKAFGGEVGMLLGGNKVSDYLGALTASFGKAAQEAVNNRLPPKLGSSVGEILNTATANGLKLPDSIVSTMSNNPKIKGLMGKADKVKGLAKSLGRFL